VTTVISSGAEARAEALETRAERARDWLAEQLEAPFLFDLFVLDEDEWAHHAGIPEYGIPHADPETHKIVLGAQPATLFGSVWERFRPDVGQDSRDAMHRVYGNPPLLEGFADLVLVHELTHLVPRGQSLPTMWHEELFADLGTVAYLASEEPDELPVYMTFVRAGCDVPSSRFPYSAAMDIGNGFEVGGFANYVWYHCHLSVAAERLWDMHGVEALRALRAGEVDVAAEAERSWP
jgi:hypothetical protein